MEVSRAIPEDAAAIGRLHAVVHDLHVDRLGWYFRAVELPDLVEMAKDTLRRRDAYAVVARIDGEVVGYAIGVKNDAPDSLFAHGYRHLYLDQIAVDPAFRRQGVGTGLVEALLKHAREEGLEQVVLDTWEFNDEARRFFLSLGFTRQMQRLAMRLDTKEA